MNTNIIYIILACFLLVFVASFVYHWKKFDREFQEAIEQDIPIDQMKNFEHMIKEFMCKNNIAHRDGTIWEIGEALNIAPGEFGGRISTQAHLNSPDKNGIMWVTFRNGLTSREREFAFAHECGHIINEDTVPANRPVGKNKAYNEQCADYIAAALLMPADEVYDYVQSNNYVNVTDKEKKVLLHGLQKKYNVDKINALRRVREVYALNGVEI